jgi:hypothetical protein
MPASFTAGAAAGWDGRCGLRWWDRSEARQPPMMRVATRAGEMRFRRGTRDERRRTRGDERLALRHVASGDDAVACSRDERAARTYRVHAERAREHVMNDALSPHASRSFIVASASCQVADFRVVSADRATRRRARARERHGRRKCRDRRGRRPRRRPPRRRVAAEEVRRGWAPNERCAPRRRVVVVPSIRVRKPKTSPSDASSDGSPDGRPPIARRV